MPGAVAAGLFFGLGMAIFCYAMSGFRDASGATWLGLAAGAFFGTAMGWSRSYSKRMGAPPNV